MLVVQRRMVNMQNRYPDTTQQPGQAGYKNSSLCGGPIAETQQGFLAQCLSS